MDDNVQVVEIGEGNSLVPNLTISVDTEEDEGDLPQVDYDMTEDTENLETTKITRQLNSFPRKKLYENKFLRDAASLGLSFEEAEFRRKKRSERFQSPLLRKAEEKDSPEELLARSQSHVDRMSKFNEKLSLDDDSFIRLEALHLIGVDKMSTDDIFAYFGTTNPFHIEWINDSTCNVVWGDSRGARIALEKVSLPLQSAHDEDSCLFDDDLDLDNETGEQIPAEKAKADDALNPVRECEEAFAKNKAKLSVRFATVGDRKENFAAKKSKYYLKHGNPHYGGAKGLLTSSYRRRYQMKRARREFRDMNPMNQNDEKRARMDDVTMTEEGGDAAMEREDEHLIQSSVKDFDRQSGSDSDDASGYGTMMADQVSQRVKAARSLIERVGEVSASHNRTKAGNNKSKEVFSRLGSKQDSNGVN